MRTRSFLAIALTAAATGPALASPTVDGAVVNPRIFNDFPSSNFSSVNNYPTNINLSDSDLVFQPGSPQPPFANLHNWHLSADGGATGAAFNNNDAFSISSNVTISVTGSGRAEGGLLIAPWYSQNVDGRFNLRTTDGEVAVFGGRLPFFSFTSTFGQTYVPGTTVQIGAVYVPQGLNAGSPGVIKYSYDNGTLFESPWLAFDMGNPAEEIPHGLWGVLNNARVGGYAQIFGTSISGPNGVSVDFENITYSPVPVPGSIGILALGGVFAARRRR